MPLMAASPLTLDETTESLARIADQVEELSRSGVHLTLPPALIEAAERIVKANRGAAVVVPSSSVSVSQLLLQVVWPGEVLTSATIRDRLAGAGRDLSSSAVNVALHRAVQRGRLERVATGRYRQPMKPSTAGGPQSGNTEMEDRHAPVATSGSMAAEAAV
jgi:hypothetical protein